MKTSEIYQKMGKIDPQGVRKLAYEEIKAAQEALRDRFPESPLLPLVELEEGKGLIHESFDVVIGEHSGWSRSKSFYASLGTYVDLMKAELESPKFSAA